MDASQALFAQIQKQKNFSKGMMTVVRQVLWKIYYPEHPLDAIACGDMGSYARGTNNDLTPDVDILFLNIPKDEAQGFVDWENFGTFEMTGSKHGFVSLDEVRKIDPKLVQAIESTQQTLEINFGHTSGSVTFHFVRSWQRFPGLVFNLSIPDHEYGRLYLDVTLDHTDYHFGLQHSQRFEQYLLRLRAEFGDQAVVQWITDIKEAKQLVKANARNPEDGWIDRTKKVPGFIIETLFAQRFPPYRSDELMEKIRQHRWQSVDQLYDQNVSGQYDQIMDAGFSFEGLLFELASNGALTLGGWENLCTLADNQT